MSPIETQEISSEDTVETSDNDNTKVVPVAESIRYRKRAQSAEKKLEELTEQLAQAKTQTAKLTEQLSDIQTEQRLTCKLAAAGTNDLETALLIAKARLQDQKDADLDGVIEQLKNEKQYLFAGNGPGVTTQKTASAKERTTDTYTILARAAKKAATTGSRADLQEYLKLRRNYL
jgi:uncharacterized protein YhaN